jgi:hypothetical protein
LLADRRILLGRNNHQFALVAATGVQQDRVVLRDVDTSRCGECGERIFRESLAGGSVWSAPLNLNRVEQHDLSGTLLRRYVRAAEWFRPWDTKEIRADEVVVELGRPRVMGVRQASDGVLWSHTTLIEQPQDLAGIDEDNARQMARLWRRVITRVQAIDDSSREFLGEMTLPGMVLPMNDRDLSAQLMVNESGDWSWKILRFRAQR